MFENAQSCALFWVSRAQTQTGHLGRLRYSAGFTNWRMSLWRKRYLYVDCLAGYNRQVE
jgi:hypothetical protein